MEILHSVTLDVEKCKGCTTCIKHCPTEAIRVRRGKAQILSQRCIDCGQCVRVCPHHAKKVVCDPFDMLKDFEYKIALPAPSFYGQFKNINDVNIILGGLLKIGFDSVFEVSKAAEMLSDLTRKTIKEPKDMRRPVISSACPAAVRLIRMRYPNLVENVMPQIAPVELAAILSRKQAAAETGLSPDKIGVFFITPCPAKVTGARYPIGGMPRVIDGAFSMTAIYKKIVGVINETEEPEALSSSGIMGIGWAVTGGESAALLNDTHLAVDGIENIKKVLEDIEDGRLPEIEFVELNACTQGCVGGCLTVENPYIAKTRIKRLMKYLPVSRNKFESGVGNKNLVTWDNQLKYSPVWRLGEDTTDALEKLNKINELYESLPGLDCASCGAPSCKAFAEDIVLGIASEEDCIFRMRERMQYLSGMGDADSYLPPPFRKSGEAQK
ncbi:MAG: 4Fe-4S binding protein [Clostridiales bacterium]|jgi:Fe-S-cluster-containing hydrogenase component 2|nr:4Fe-4S binding protein [Clostridiales bacterium]